MTMWEKQYGQEDICKVQLKEITRKVAVFGPRFQLQTNYVLQRVESFAYFYTDLCKNIMK